MLHVLDQEKVSIDQVFVHLKCSRKGLTDEEGRRRLQTFGPNKLEEKKVCLILSRFILLILLHISRLPLQIFFIYLYKFTELELHNILILYKT